MKIIITEEQLKLIVENEGENLIDLTGVYESGVSPNKWDDMFLHINKKKGGRYDGYYIDDDVELYDYGVIELNYLVRVEGRLNSRYSQIKSLPMLSYVGGWLDLSYTSIKSLPMLSYVGGYLDLFNTPLSRTTNREELRKQINVKENIYL